VARDTRAVFHPWSQLSGQTFKPQPAPQAGLKRRMNLRWMGDLKVASAYSMLRDPAGRLDGDLGRTLTQAACAFLHEWKKRSDRAIVRLRTRSG
jgi:hypothetical protein